MFVKVKDNIIIGIYCGYKSKINVLAEESFIDVDKNFPGIVGMDIRIVDVKNGTIMPIEDQIKHGYYYLSERQEIIDSEIVDKPIEKLWIEGIEPLPEELKIVNNEVVNKSVYELYSEKIITFDEATATVFALRKNHYSMFADPLKMESDYMKELGQKDWEKKKQEWLNKVKEIKNTYPKIKELKE